jgi:type II secretory pathway component GspD/PulD (secretin)
MNRFFKIIVCLLLFLTQTVLNAEIQTNLPLDGDSTNYNINTSDTNSLYTRSDVYEFNNVNVSEIAPIINKTLSEYGSISINETLNMVIINDQEDKLKNIISLCNKLDLEGMDKFTKIRTERIPLSFAQPADLEIFLTSYLSLDGSIQIDENYNVLVVHDHESKIELIKKEIEKYDIPPREIKLTVDIFELSANDISDIGLDYDNMMQHVNVNLADQTLKTFQKSKQKTDDHNYPNPYTDTDIDYVYREQLNGNLGLNMSLTDMLRLMKQNESIQIISSPSVTTLSNTVALLSVSNSVSMSVKPYIGNSEYIKLDIDCNIDDSTSGQHLFNKVYLKNKEPFIIGEISKTKIIKTKRKVPILGSLLPFLFSRESESEVKVKVVIFITPEIIELDDYSKRSSETKQQLVPEK